MYKPKSVKIKGGRVDARHSSQFATFRTSKKTCNNFDFYDITECSGSSIAAELEKMKPVEHIRLQEANITMGPMALLGPRSFKVHF